MTIYTEKMANHTEVLRKTERKIYFWPRTSLETVCMKTELIKVLTFVCMVVVLGLQQLLQGSWKVPELESTKRNQPSRS